MKKIASSELVLNADGSVYHLHLQPEQIAPVIFTVGDPKRVGMISRHFDRIDHQVEKREFVTHTGELAGQRLSVISTGIGTDNIDIVLNELDALVNIDLQTREVKTEKTSLRLIRVGTSGSLHPDLEVGQLVVGRYGLGLDGLLAYYRRDRSEEERELEEEAGRFFAGLDLELPFLYGAPASGDLFDRLADDLFGGITLTCPGFYGPQGRVLRADSLLRPDFFEKAHTFRFRDTPITNFEMETSALYALGALLGHQAIAFNVLLANRLTGDFSQNPNAEVERLITAVLERVGKLP